MSRTDERWKVEHSLDGTYAEIVVGDTAILRPDEPCTQEDFDRMELAVRAVNAHEYLTARVAALETSLDFYKAQIAALRPTCDPVPRGEGSDEGRHMTSYQDMHTSWEEK